MKFTGMEYLAKKKGKVRSHIDTDTNWNDDLVQGLLYPWEYFEEFQGIHTGGQGWSVLPPHRSRAGVKRGEWQPSMGQTSTTWQAGHKGRSLHDVATATIHHPVLPLCVQLPPPPRPAPPPAARGTRLKKDWKPLIWWIVFRWPGGPMEKVTMKAKQSKQLARGYLVCCYQTCKAFDLSWMHYWLLSYLYAFL